METIAHSVLFYSMMSTATFAALESAFRHQPLLTAGRVTGMFLQGAWFIAAARLLYGGAVVHSAHHHGSVSKRNLFLFGDNVMGKAVNALLMLWQLSTMSCLKL